MTEIRLRGASKRFGTTSVLRGVDLAVPEGSLTAILGKSGSGKTTLLRIIAGFEKLDAGTLTLDGQLVDDSRRSLPPQHRRVGYVPQDGALFPNLTALANIAFGLPRREHGTALRLLEMVGLEGLGNRRPSELSGGQQQRVALARALAVRPSVVLLDEPFSSLDASLRVAVRRDVARILKDAGTTTILVTHDQDEALSMADQVALINDGSILAAASPRELYAEPRSAAVASSLGEINILRASLDGNRARCAIGEVALNSSSGSTQGFVLVRSENIDVHESATSHATAAHVREFDFFGHDSLARLTIDSDGTEITARLAGDRSLAIGQAVWVGVRSAVSALPHAR
jgi:iron(III) transport system ATP-binding protein